MIKINSFVKVIKTNEILKVTRIDRHVYPVCAGYRRFRMSDLILVSGYVILETTGVY